MIADLEVRSIRHERALLPITDTGYLSQFHPPGTVEAQVIAWLDDEAAKPAWWASAEATRQGEPF